MSSTLIAPDVVAEVAPQDMEIPKGFEFVNGQLKELNVSAKSSGVGGEVFAEIKLFCRKQYPGWVFPADTSFRCFPDDERKFRKPDSAFIAFERYTAEQYDSEGHISVCPDLAVEVVSPNDLAADVNQKVADWLRAGVRLLWVIDPDTKTIVGYRADRPNVADVFREADTLTGEPVLPGFAVPVADLFRLPAIAPAADAAG